VPQELLDEPDVHPLFQEQRGRGVPEHVRGHVEEHPGVPGVSPERCAYGLLGELGAVPVAEEGGVFLVVLLPESQVVLQGGQGFFVAELEDPLPSSFTQDTDPLLAEVDVLVSQAADLSDAGSGGEEELDDGDVSEEEAVGGGFLSGGLLEAVEVAEELLEVCQRDASRQAAGLFDPDVHLAEGVHRDGVFSFEEVEEGLQGRHLPFDTLLLQMVEEALDVVPQGGFVDSGEVGDRELPGEVLGELPQVDGVRLQSLGAEIFLVLTVEQELFGSLFDRHPGMITSEGGTRAGRGSVPEEPSPPAPLPRAGEGSKAKARAQALYSPGGAWGRAAR
jgi:hypothetical protein